MYGEMHSGACESRCGALVTQALKREGVTSPLFRLVEKWMREDKAAGDTRADRGFVRCKRPCSHTVVLPLTSVVGRRAGGANCAC